MYQLVPKSMFLSDISVSPSAILFLAKSLLLGCTDKGLPAGVTWASAGGAAIWQHLRLESLISKTVTCWFICVLSSVLTVKRDDKRSWIALLFETVIISWFSSICSTHSLVCIYFSSQWRLTFSALGPRHIHTVLYGKVKKGKSFWQVNQSGSFSVLTAQTWPSTSDWESLFPKGLALKLLGKLPVCPWSATVCKVKSVFTRHSNTGKLPWANDAIRYHFLMDCNGH